MVGTRAAAPGPAAALTADAEPARGRALRRRLVLLVAGVCAAVWLSTLYDAVRDRAATLDAAVLQDDNVAGALAEQAARALQAADLVLREAALLDPGPAPRPGATDAIPDLLRRTMSGVPQVRNLFLFDPARALNVSAAPPGTPSRDVSDRSYFVAQRERADAGLFVSEPVISRVTGQPTFILSRRLPGEAFHGIVGAAVDVGYIRRFYHALDLGPDSSIALLRSDGITLVSRENDAVGAAPSPWQGLMGRLGEGDALHTRSVEAGRGEVLVSLRRVPGYPVVVVVARSEQAVLAGWRTKTWTGFARTLAITALAALLLVAFLRQLRRHERVTAQLHQAQKLEALGTLAGGIAHDFNNILGAVLGYGELASQEASPGSSQRRYLDNIILAAERARALVARILAFSRPGVGSATPVDLQPLIAEVSSLASAVLPPDVRVDVEIEAGRLVTRGDSAQLHQVLSNLLTNAVQAVGERGRVGLRAAPCEVREARNCTVGRLTPGAYARIDIVDSGAGMTPAQLERIFEPFFTTKPVGAGTGLGLSLVHGIVLDHDAALDIESAPGAGTTVSVWLPLTSEEPLAVPSLPRGPRGKGETILVVDDEESLVRLTEEVLAGLGYEPVGCVGAREALRVFASAPERFDAVLTDVVMPGVSGVELLGELRRTRPGLPAVLMTGRADAAELAAMAGSSGAEVVLAKPATAAQLAASLAGVCNRA